MSATIETNKTAAIVAIRYGRGSNIDYHPVNVYFALVERDENGRSVYPSLMTSSIDYVRFSENEKANKRLVSLTSVLKTLAGRVNTGEMTFEAARDKAATLVQKNDPNHAGQMIWGFPKQN